MSSTLSRSLALGTALRFDSCARLGDDLVAGVAVIRGGARTGWFVALVRPAYRASGDLDRWVESAPYPTEEAAFRQLAQFLATWAGW